MIQSTTHIACNSDCMQTCTQEHLQSIRAARCLALFDMPTALLVQVAFEMEDKIDTAITVYEQDMQEAFAPAEGRQLRHATSHSEDYLPCNLWVWPEQCNDEYVMMNYGWLDCGMGLCTLLLRKTQQEVTDCSPLSHSQQPLFRSLQTGCGLSDFRISRKCLS